MEIDDNELANVEMVFAQKLACGEPPVRQKALVALQQWIRKTAKKQGNGCALGFCYVNVVVVLFNDHAVCSKRDVFVSFLRV